VRRGVQYRTAILGRDSGASLTATSQAKLTATDVGCSSPVRVLQTVKKDREKPPWRWCNPLVKHRIQPTETPVR
jgi:hypothetical protein